MNSNIRKPERSLQERDDDNHFIISRSDSIFTHLSKDDDQYKYYVYSWFILFSKLDLNIIHYQLKLIINKESVYLHIYNNHYFKQSTWILI